MQMPLAFAFVILLITPALADPLPRDTQIVRVGPCAIATTYKADRFDNCTMSRSAESLESTFVRNQDGLLLLLDSPEAEVGSR